MFEKLLINHKVSLNKTSYTVDEDITKQLVRDGQGVALLRCDEACELEKAGSAHIWRKGTVRLPFGLAYLSEPKNAAILPVAVAAVMKVWDLPSS